MFKRKERKGTKACTLDNVTCQTIIDSGEANFTRHHDIQDVLSGNISLPDGLQRHTCDTPVKAMIEESGNPKRLLYKKIVPASLLSKNCRSCTGPHPWFCTKCTRPATQHEGLSHAESHLCSARDHDWQYSTGSAEPCLTSVTNGSGYPLHAGRHTLFDCRQTLHAPGWQFQISEQFCKGMSRLLKASKGTDRQASQAIKVMCSHADNTDNIVSGL